LAYFKKLGPLAVVVRALRLARIILQENEKLNLKINISLKKIMKRTRKI